MNSKRFFILFALVILLLLGLWLPVSAAPTAQQQVPTLTPGPDGRIIYVVLALNTYTTEIYQGLPTASFIRTSPLRVGGGR